MSSFLGSPVAARLRELTALLFVFAVLVLPNRLDWVNAQAFVFVPLELWLFGLLLLVPGGGGRWLCGGLGLVLGLGLILRLADLAAFQVYARAFNPVFDAYLLGYGYNLLRGSIGLIGASVVAFSLLALTLGLLWVSFGALATLRRGLRRQARSSALWLLAALVLSSGWRLAGLPRTTTYFSDQLREHTTSLVAGLADLRAFTAELSQDRWQTVPDAALFNTLAGKDVVVVFVESYGRAALEYEPFISALGPVLEQGERALAAAGFGMRSAWLQSPTVGGLSWLAHATLLSGLWIDSQLRHDSLMLSAWPSLNRLFQRAGWRSVGLMPAITLAWPEGQYYGYDQLYTAQDLGYKGKPYNWVTMPDQYVLSALERLERTPQPRPPVMAELALISSHAPWTPLAQLVPWTAVGDGRVFNDQASAGPTPEVVWSNTTSIREHYGKAVAYSLDTLISWLLKFGDENLVVLILGDHQPAPLVSGDSDNREVPVHLLARDATVLAAVADWHWQAGLRPDASAPSWRMDALRDRLVEAFTPTAP